MFFLDELIKNKRFYFLKVLRFLNLKEDFDESGSVESIISNIEFRSGNAWGLIFAIFIASIGLQVNSTSVIIGAMLISPLMGPIVGAGFALGTHHFNILKKSLTHLFYAVAISLSTSTVFFLFSPSNHPQSELLARTHPTFYDVLIAFFGGAAGMVAASRRQKGNAIPGVAIATALMPPLCTAGYGLAHLAPSIFLGAFYLFLINITFILLSTYLFVRLLNYKIYADRDSNKDRIIHSWMRRGAIIIIFPSLITAWYLHEKTNFEDQSEAFITNEFNYRNTAIGQKKREFHYSKGGKVILKTIGSPLTKEQQAELKSKLSLYDLKPNQLEIIPLNVDTVSIKDIEERFITKKEFFELVNELESLKLEKKSKK